MSKIEVKSTENVCVQVDCRCPYGPGWLWYPKNIIGLHRIEANDPRAKVGRLWTKVGHCCGNYYSQSCEEENCDPCGKVVEVISDCATCPHKDSCPFKNLSFPAEQKI